MPIDQQETLGHILWDGLAGLPARTRRVMQLRYQERHEVAAIAASMAIDEPAVRRLLAEGHGALRGLVAPTLRVHGFL